MTASVVLLFDLSFHRIKLFEFCYVFFISLVYAREIFYFWEKLNYIQKSDFWGWF